MYAPFFGLTQEPFSIAPDPRYLFMSERHREALAHLVYGLQAGGGFVLLTGEIGAGKTTVCRCFLEQIPRRCNVAYIFNPKLNTAELLQSICDEFRIPLPEGASASLKTHVDALNEFLLKTHAVGQNNVLIIDEAQNLSPEVLEQLRLLTNLETEKRKLLQVIVFGQPELEDKLNHPSIRQLKQRIAFHYCLTPMVRDEVDFYVQHRLSIAGHTGGRLFTSGALWLLRKRTQCVPRLVNIIAHKALLSAFGKGHKQVTFWDVKAAADDTNSTQRPYKKWGLVFLWMALAVGIVWLLMDKGLLK